MTINEKVTELFLSLVQDRETPSYSSNKDYMGETGLSFSQKQFKPRATNHRSYRLKSQIKSSHNRVNSACGSSRFFNRYRKEREKKRLQQSQQVLKRPRPTLNNLNSSQSSKKIQNPFSAEQPRSQSRSKIQSKVSANFISFMEN